METGSSIFCGFKVTLPFVSKSTCSNQATAAQLILFAVFDVLSQAIQIVQESPVDHMSCGLQRKDFRIGFYEVDTPGTSQPSFVQHHQQFIGGQSTHILRSLRHIGGIQTIGTDGDINVFGIFADNFQGLINGSFPTVFMDVDGTDDRCTIFHGIIVFFPVVSGPADPNMSDFGCIHVGIIIDPIKRRATGQFIITEMRVVVQMGIEVQHTDFLGMPFGNFTDNRVCDPMVPANGDGDNLGISQFANPLPDGFEGKVVVAILGGNIAGISNSQVIEAIQVVIRKETGITEE